jgi:hypothetical protein
MSTDNDTTAEHGLWRAAATEAVLRWDVVRRAVEEQWGGTETADMAMWIGSVVADWFLEYPEGAYGRGERESMCVCVCDSKETREENSCFFALVFALLHFTLSLSCAHVSA